MVLSVRNLSIERGEEIVVSDVSFTLAPGDALLLRGENGAGKSTLLRALAGLLPPASGTIAYEGSGDFARTRLREAVHYLGHDNAMKDQMTLADNLAFWRKVAGHAHLEPEEALELVGLGGLGPVPFAHLSTGQRRRGAIARLLVAWRPIWLLDEPTAGLDTPSNAQFGALMEAHREDGGIVVAATHVPLGIHNPGVMKLIAPGTAP